MYGRKLTNYGIHTTFVMLLCYREQIYSVLVCPLARMLEIIVDVRSQPHKNEKNYKLLFDSIEEEEELS